MSVLIKGMDEIPEDGTVFTVMHDNGRVYIKRACTYGYSMELVKLPESHGRLVDADELIADMINGIRAGNLEEGYERYQNINNVDDCVNCVRYADTVIEAEGERRMTIKFKFTATIEALDAVRRCDEDCISRRAVKKKLEQNFAYMRAFGVDRCMNLIDEIPAVETESKWIS